MNNYKTLKFPKNYLIYEEGNYPKDVFYIITKGKAKSYSSNSKNYEREYDVGFIAGLMNLATNEPYFVTIETIEETEVIEMNLSDVKNLINTDLIKKIYDYLNSAFETWLSKYYSNLVKNKVDLYYKDNIFVIAEIYKKNEFYDAAYKLYADYIKEFDYAENVEGARIELSKLEPMPPPKKFRDNIYLYMKGSCLYTELKPSNSLYIIMSGKIGIYNAINGELLLRDAYGKNYILYGYGPKSDYKPLLTSAIALETSYVKTFQKEEFLEMIIKDKQLRSYNIKMMSVKIINVLYKIRAIEEENITLKLFIIISTILKIEILFEESESILLSHTIDDIKNSVNNISEDNILNNLRKIKSVEIVKDKYIKITNINNFFKEYKEYYEYQKK
ncbi:cyclic nucleotide-binding domain-containing protein [Brachyspira innocens]|uniref:cyclic nucleotide-binding domain-containing protein n=1 Tax=Brachyspira innocens TaxID=13264 RepID=UPI0026EE4ED9|nr:cyclic nucleotide-binding domain-containing protein [Brachyspira innocens]